MARERGRELGSKIESQRGEEGKREANSRDKQAPSRAEISDSRCSRLDELIDRFATIINTTQDEAYQSRIDT